MRSRTLYPGMSEVVQDVKMSHRLYWSSFITHLPKLGGAEAKMGGFSCILRSYGKSFRASKWYRRKTYTLRMCACWDVNPSDMKDPKWGTKHMKKT